MSLQALITPVVAVLLILAGVVLSVLLTGTSIQNDAAVTRSQQLVDSAFRTVGRDLGHLAVTVARSQAAYDHLVQNFDVGWARERFSTLDSGFGTLGTMVVDPQDNILYQSGLPAVPISATLHGLIGDARKLSGSDSAWTSAFVIFNGQLHVASASNVQPPDGKVSGKTVLVILKAVDDALLARLSKDFLVKGLAVHKPSEIHGTVGIIISAPHGESLAAITWKPARPGDALFEDMLVPIVIASLIAALLLATFLRTAVRAAQQLKQGAEALAESGEALEYSESMLSAIINGVADGIVTIDAAGNITSVNASMCRIFGYDTEELLGEQAGILLAGVKGEEGNPRRSLTAQSGKEENEYREFTGRRKDGSRFVLDTAISYITYQSEAVSIAIMRDVTERRQAEETLNLLTTGMALVDRDCRLLLANRSASRILDSGDGLVLSHGRITATRREQIDDLRNLVSAVCMGQNAADDQGAGVMTIERADGARPLSIKIAPVELNAGENSSRVAAVFVRDLDVRQSVPPEVVAKLFGLTFAEARVVVELVKGKRPQEVADDIGVSLNTVRNQLKQIFSKTNTGRQSELVSLVLSSAAFVSDHGLDVEENGGAAVRLTGS